MIILSIGNTSLSVCVLFIYAYIYICIYFDVSDRVYIFLQLSQSVSIH